VREALVLILVADPLFKCYVIISNISLVISLHSSLKYFLCFSISHIFHDLNLLRGPFVKADTFDLRNVCAHRPVDSRAPYANENTQVGRRPS